MRQRRGRGRRDDQASIERPEGRSVFGSMRGRNRSQLGTWMPDLIMRSRAASSIWQDLIESLAVFHNWQCCRETDAAQLGKAIGSSSAMAAINKQRRMSKRAIPIRFALQDSTKRLDEWYANGCDKLSTDVRASRR